MKFIEDPRIKMGRRNLALAWVYYSLFLVASMAFSYTMGNRPYFLGLPRWAAMGCIIVPAIFVVMLIVVVEKFIPDVPLADDDESENKK